MHGEMSCKRGVRFAAENEVFVFDLAPDVAVDELWFSAEDYASVKAKSRDEARQWRRSGYDVLLRDTFEMPRSDAQEFMNAFAQMEGSLSKRGLERHLSRQHGEERSDLKDRARQAVVIHQDRLRRQGTRPEDMADKLANIYLDVCRCAKIFARRLGRADAKVALHGEDSTIAERIVDMVNRREGPRKMDRRASSNYSIKSGSSFDSKRTWGPMGTKKQKPRCPGSPASPVDEYYAAIA